MATWKCEACGSVREGRCKPKKCESCGGGTFIKEADEKNDKIKAKK